jgi:predicted ATPase
MKIKSIFIENYKVLKNFKIDFTNKDGINPITILAGINGSGKTTLLEFIFETFKKQNIANTNKKSYIEIEESNLFDSTPIKPYFHLTSEFLKNEKNKFAFNIFEKIYYYKASEENISAQKIIIDYIDELIYEKDIKSSQAYDKMRQSLNDTLSSINLQVEFSKLDKEKEIYFKNRKSDEIKLMDLSGGEKEMITKVFPLFISPIKDSVILIDEPESSLHPNWQNEIISLYKIVAQKNNNQIIIATHSPHIVSAVENKYVKVLMKENEDIKVIDISSKSFGRKVDEILLDIFKVKGLRTPVVETKLTKLKELLFQNKMDKEEFNCLLSELENSIGKFDGDLAMIRLEILKRRKENEANK